MKLGTRLAVTGLAFAVAFGCKSAGSAPLRAYAQDPCAAASTEQKAGQARDLAKQKKYAEAEAPAREALSACGSHAVAAAALGESLVGQKKYDAAVSSLEAVVAAKADVAYAYYWLGHAYYQKKQNDKMARNFDKFLQLAPNAPEAQAVSQLLAGIR